LLLYLLLFKHLENIGIPFNISIRNNTCILSHYSSFTMCIAIAMQSIYTEYYESKAFPSYIWFLVLLVRMYWSLERHLTGCIKVFIQNTVIVIYVVLLYIHIHAHKLLYVHTVYKITLQTWYDTLSGHNQVCTDI